MTSNTLRAGLWSVMVPFGVALTMGVVAAQQTTAGGVYSQAQATRGASLYAENCAQCHTPTLVGGDLAPALTGPGFIARWTTGKPLSALFDYTRTEMPMNSPGGLNAQHNADLLAFLLQKSGYPAGTVDLPSTSEKLASVTVSERSRP